MLTGSLNTWPNTRKTMPACLVQAVERVKALDLASLALGRHAIEGDDIFLLIQEMDTKPAAMLRPEAHRRYIDVQILLSGSESFGIAFPDPTLQPVEDRLEKDDIAFYPGHKSEYFLTLTPGDFVVFFPGEFHRPCSALQEPSFIRKAVIKVDQRLLG